MIRSLVLPIAGPVDATWAELRPALREAWAESTRCANWMLTELYARDIRREPGDQKLAKMPRIYLYPEARQRFPALASQTVASLERDVSRKYRARRYELLWTQSVSLPVMRYPVGLPLPSQMWRLEHDDGGAYLFSARIGDRRWTLRLRGGPHFRRMTAMLDRVIAGEAIAGAATLYRIRAHGTDHRSTATPEWRLAVRIPVTTETARPSYTAPSVMRVHTAREALLTASCGERVWREHHDHIRRAISTHRRQLQELSDDLKAERRRPKRNREGMVARMGTLAHRHAQRMRSWLHEAAAHLVGYAQRQHVARLEYDDHDKSWIDSFPWHELGQRIREKCEAAGIEFASGEVTEQTPPPLEQENLA
jgi:hypothetical protein